MVFIEIKGNCMVFIEIKGNLELYCIVFIDITWELEFQEK
jgi:hypothetical protein